MDAKRSTKRARSPTARILEAPPGWSKRWQFYRSAAAAMKHAICHRVVSQIVLPEVAAFMPNDRVVLRTHRDETCGVGKVVFTGSARLEPPVIGDVEFLAGFPHLTCLLFKHDYYYFERVKLSDEVLARIATRLPTLVAIENIDVPNMTVLAALPRLERLTLTVPGSHELPGIGELLQLTSVHLRYGFNPAALTELAKLPVLRSFVFQTRRPHYEIAGVAHHLPHLTHLAVRFHCSIDAAALAELWKLRELRHLVLTNPFFAVHNGIPATAFEGIVTIKGLTRLDLNQHSVSLEGFTQIARLQALTRLNLRSCGHML